MFWLNCLISQSRSHISTILTFIIFVLFVLRRHKSVYLKKTIIHTFLANVSAAVCVCVCACQSPDWGFLRRKKQSPGEVQTEAPGHAGSWGLGYWKAKKGERKPGESKITLLCQLGSGLLGQRAASSTYWTVFWRTKWPCEDSAKKATTSMWTHNVIMSCRWFCYCHLTVCMTW